MAFRGRQREIKREKKGEAGKGRLRGRKRNSRLEEECVGDKSV